VGVPINPYSAGKRVYSGGVRAPNTGAVANKTGYLQRDIKREAQQRALADRYKRFSASYR
jgi:hypothetical protein